MTTATVARPIPKSSKRKMTHEEAYASADRLAQLLAPECERLTIAGSIRRGMPRVGDVEIVAIPGQRTADLFGEATASRVDWWLAEAEAAGNIVASKNGPKFKQFRWRDEETGLSVPVDLFLTTPDNWGYILMVRTGSARFSRKMVTPKSQDGYRPSDIVCSGGQVWRGGVTVAVPEERDLFALWGMDYVEPRDRR